MAVVLPAKKCGKLELREHIDATIQKKEIEREIISISCDVELVERLVSNYIIVKKILSNLCWQEQLLCKLVCRTWRDAVRTLQRECLAPHDFVISVQTPEAFKLTLSSKVTTEPLIIFTFANTGAVGLTSECAHVTPAVCKPPCTGLHDVLDIIDNTINSPKDCMLSIKTDYLSYMPVARAPTSAFTVKKNKLSTLPPFVGGLVIPKIPDVDCHIINIKLNHNVQDEFFDPVSKIIENNLIKGILVFVTDKYFLHSVEDVQFLNHFMDLQEDVSYAFGGCIIDDTLTTSDITSLVESINSDKEFVSENLISIGIFTVPKNRDEESKAKNNFEMYSLIIESSVWTKPKIKKIIQEFSESVPRFEHSVVLKLACIGRDQRHDIEQDAFRECFPDTPLIGCYGNGELGANFPARPEQEPKTAKRARSADHVEFTVMYSYSTVFVYIGWGKMISK